MKLFASFKMDIANYIPWLTKRLHDGYFDVEENPKTINRYLLKNLDEIVLYTRSPSKIYKNRDVFKNYNTSLITFISFYDQFYEPKLKNKEKSLETIRKCKPYFNNYAGYGPVFFTRQHDMKFHFNQFEFLCESVKGYVKGIYIDFHVSDSCQKSKNLGIVCLKEEEQKVIMAGFKEIALKYRIPINILYRELCEKDIDVGLINCCPYVCTYCPNITNPAAASDKYKVFDPENSLLYGIIQPNQKIVEIDLSKQDTEFYQQTFSF